MHLTTTVLFYLLIGMGVAAAVYLAGESAARGRWFRTLSAIVFWPLYLPGLLQWPGGTSDFRAKFAASQVADPLATAIRQVEAELDVALGSLDGWSDAVLAREAHRFAELRAAWHAQAAKIHELDELLCQPMFALPQDPPHASPPVAGDRGTKSELARRANIDRLRGVRQRLHDDLLGTLAWVRELVTMIHLAKYTGAPASRAEELVMQIATCVEGLSEVAAWREGTAEDSQAHNLIQGPKC